MYLKRLIFVVRLIALNVIRVSSVLFLRIVFYRSLGEPTVGWLKLGG